MYGTLVVPLFVGLATLACGPGDPDVPNGSLSLEERIAAIDEELAGDFGAYVKRLESGEEWAHRAERPWYQASTVKVPVAIVVLQMVEEGRLSLDDTLTLQASDFVDGAGELLWRDPGTEYTIRELLVRSLTQSDSTATDMLIRLVGEAELNRRLQGGMDAQGFERITTILQVRFDAYGEIHPEVEELSNLDFVRLNQVPLGQERYEAFLDKLPNGGDGARVERLDDAFERYYERRLNSATLNGFGDLLERLHRGDLLSTEHTEWLLGTMQDIETGDDRIVAGLPRGVDFAHKTGTQVARACNVGVAEPRTEEATVVVACAERYESLGDAEAAFQALGRALAEEGVVEER